MNCFDESFNKFKDQYVNCQEKQNIVIDRRQNRHRQNRHRHQKHCLQCQCSGVPSNFMDANVLSDAGNDIETDRPAAAGQHPALTLDNVSCCRCCCCCIYF